MTMAAIYSLGIGSLVSNFDGLISSLHVKHMQEEERKDKKRRKLLMKSVFHSR